MSDDELDVFANLNKFLNVTPNQYQRDLEEFAKKLSSDEDVASNPESPITPRSPVKSVRTRPTRKKLLSKEVNKEPETKTKISRAQRRLDKIKADLIAFSSTSPEDILPPKVHTPSPRKTRNQRHTSKTDVDLTSLEDILPPKVSKPSPRKARNQRRTSKPDVDLTSCVPVTMGFVNLDSDDDNGNHSFSTAVQEADLSLESENYEMSILIRWKGNCEKFTLRRHQRFEELMKILAQRENVDIKNIYLDFEEKFLEPETTPHSINYTAGKFICGRVLALERTKPHKEKKDPNLINIKIQSQSFKKPLTLKILKNEPMKILFIKLAEELKCNPSKIQLKFDGDKVLMEQTAEEIELEGGEILDLIIEK